MQSSPPSRRSAALPGARRQAERLAPQALGLPAQRRPVCPFRPASLSASLAVRRRAFAFARFAAAGARRPRACARPARSAFASGARRAARLRWRRRRAQKPSFAEGRPAAGCAAGGGCPVADAAGASAGIVVVASGAEDGTDGRWRRSTRRARGRVGLLGLLGLTGGALGALALLLGLLFRPRLLLLSLALGALLLGAVAARDLRRRGLGPGEAALRREPRAVASTVVGPSRRRFAAGLGGAGGWATRSAAAKRRPARVGRLDQAGAGGVGAFRSDWPSGLERR